MSQPPADENISKTDFRALFDGEVAREQIITLTPDEQLAFWVALCEPPKLTPQQEKLGRLMRGMT